jgi:hypothetical protein
MRDFVFFVAFRGFRVSRGHVWIGWRLLKREGREEGRKTPMGCLLYALIGVIWDVVTFGVILLVDDYIISPIRDRLGRRAARIRRRRWKEERER